MVSVTVIHESYIITGHQALGEFTKIHLERTSIVSIASSRKLSIGMLEESGKYLKV